jgi:hypothetical protein
MKNLEFKSTNYKIIIYDCGIIGQTGSSEINKTLAKCCYDGNWICMVDTIIPKHSQNPKHTKVLQEYIKYTQSIHYKNSMGRINDIISKALSIGMKTNKNLVRMIQGIMIFDAGMSLGFNRFAKVVGKTNNAYITIYCYRAILQHLHKYGSLVSFYDSWLAEDPGNITTFKSWLHECFGHTDEDVFFEVILEALNL